MNTVHVSGMSCGHCREAVQKAVMGVSGVEEAKVDLQSGEVTWKGDASLADPIKDAIVAIGFDVK